MKIWIVRFLLILCVAFLIPGANNYSKKAKTADEINESMREVIRIPLSQVKAGSMIQVRTFIHRSKIPEDSLGKGFFQASIIKTGSTKWMLPWSSNLVGVTAKQGDRDLIMTPTNTPFYLHSSGSLDPLGLVFTPKAGKDCDITLTFNGSDFPQDAELVVAPNWPNPMFIKDQMVAAMLAPTFDKIFIWANKAGLMISLVSIFLLFSIPTKKTV